MQGIRKTLAVALIIFGAAAISFSEAKSPNKKLPVVQMNGPTVIAFFITTQEKVDQDADANEALADFQIYAHDVREKLKSAGVAFHEIYGPGFDVREGKKSSTYHPKQSVGYYFVAPGKRPRVEYGVMTDGDLMQVALEYFGNSLK
jgi:hypothetical protein